VIEFNRVENVLVELISNLVQFNDLNFRNILIGSLSFQQKNEILHELLNEKYKGRPRLLKIIEKDIAKIESISKKRNMYIHSLWGTGAFGDTKVISLKANRRGRVTKNYFSQKEMTAYISEIKSVQDINIFRLYKLSIRDKIEKSKARL
jgi:hypothetical protein